MKTTSKKIKLLLFAVGVVFLFLAPPASADILVQTDNDSIGMTSTNWDDSFEFDYFNSSLGDLSKVEIRLTGNLLGSMSAEELETPGIPIDLNLQATVSIFDEYGATLVATLPTETRTFTASSVDGVADFQILGESAVTYSGLTATDTEWLTITDPGDLLGYYGSGTFFFDVGAVGSSNASGSGNVATFFSTSASASGEIRYYVTGAPVPEPATMILFGSGLMGLAGFGRKKLQKKEA